ncbi:hypothetical protein CO657_31295 (plasmid) [Rhizobium acidisoli]|uniref:Uncharacterized protein n=1 Tax=Rhizobium acidisoli TaxID=1538158 RepID=A0AAE6C547_9HYPH|nr:hypothetical protein [Rhizobium acidisoli]KPH04302.1 hypothetical protein AOG23_34000 [Rhizobium acidisoli]QAS82290.1 hypothetical protein CO657_31295 [Rhizobium acidisoli]
MASNVPSAQINKKAMFIDPAFRMFARGWGYAKQIFIDPDFRSRVFHAAFFSSRFSRRKLATIAGVLVIVGGAAGNFNDIVEAGSTVWQTTRSVLDPGSAQQEKAAVAHQQKIDFEEKMSSDMFEDVKRLQSIVTEKTKAAQIAPTNTESPRTGRALAPRRS